MKCWLPWRCTRRDPPIYGDGSKVKPPEQHQNARIRVGMRNKRGTLEGSSSEAYLVGSRYLSRSLASAAHRPPPGEDGRQLQGPSAFIVDGGLERSRPVRGERERSPKSGTVRFMNWMDETWTVWSMMDRDRERAASIKRNEVIRRSTLSHVFMWREPSGAVRCGLYIQRSLFDAERESWPSIKIF